jgi:hypothetical protein
MPVMAVTDSANTEAGFEVAEGNLPSSSSALASGAESMPIVKSYSRVSQYLHGLGTSWAPLDFPLGYFLPCDDLKPR